jgi:hypothetical protein
MNRFLLRSHDGTLRAALFADLLHPGLLDLSRLLSGLLYLKENGATTLQAQNVWHSRQLIRPSVNLHRPPSVGIGGAND